MRCWHDGVIPDLAEAVDSPRLLTDDPENAQRVLDLIASVPTPVWGRDELGAGEMWNSNSMMSWVITRAGLNAESIHPPLGGRAPGWQAGIIVAQRRALEGRAFSIVGGHGVWPFCAHATTSKWADSS